MHSPYHIPAWKTAPFLRLLLPFIAGILLQWYLPISLSNIFGSLSFTLVIIFIIYRLPLKARYTLKVFQGVIINLLLVELAMLMTFEKDITHKKSWYGNLYSDSSFIILNINEPPEEKARSFKAEASVRLLINKGRQERVIGRLLIYFAKDSAGVPVQYGDKILINKRPQRIKNSGNPGAFDYQRYEAFQQLYHQLYLKKGDYILLNEKQKSFVPEFIFGAREYVIKAIKTYVPGDKNIIGIAEALLIGYKEDLDKDLLQLYNKTGVVHIIAVSGLHLGLIYVVLLWILNRLPMIRRSRLAKVLLILGSLWFFSILTGAAASVLRSAVMFSCIVVGKNYFKQSSIYNSLATSAFILLSYNPYFLWDVGFQLSYLAVFGIVWIQPFLYRSLYFPQSWLRKLWNMSSVTIAAQLMTFPLCLLYFHQFPNLFLFTNLLAVPLSTITLFAEIVLITVSSLPLIPNLAGKLISALIGSMNNLMEFFSNLPYAIVDHINISAMAAVLLYGLVVFLFCWFRNQNRRFLYWSYLCLVCLVFLHIQSRWDLENQERIVIYNIPRYSAVAFIYKDQYFFKADSSLLHNEQLLGFHVKPARIAYRLRSCVSQLPGLFNKGIYWQFGDKKLLWVDSKMPFPILPEKLNVDAVILSRNPNLKIAEITRSVRPSIIIFDASNSLWKIEKWKKECEKLILRSHSIPEQGAFIF